MIFPVVNILLCYYGVVRQTFLELLSKLNASQLSLIHFDFNHLGVATNIAEKRKHGLLIQISRRKITGRHWVKGIVRMARWIRHHIANCILEQPSWSSHADFHWQTSSSLAQPSVSKSASYTPGIISSRMNSKSSKANTFVWSRRMKRSGWKNYKVSGNTWETSTANWNKEWTLKAPSTLLQAFCKLFLAEIYMAVR